MKFIYHAARKTDWEEAKKTGIYKGPKTGSFLHFSTKDTVIESIEKHLPRQKDLILLKVNVENISNLDLRWEWVRKANFPHLYGALPIEAVDSATPLELDLNEKHIFPPLE